MALNPSIILAGQQFDLAGSMVRGNELAAQTNALQDQNALRQVYRTEGAGILQGNQGSLNALAAVDPNLAIGAQGGVLQNQTAARSLEVLNAQEKRAIAEAARNMDEAQKAEAAAKVKQQVLGFIAAPTPEIFDQMVTQAGKPELAGMWANRQVLGAQYVSSVEEALKLSQGPDQSALTDGAPAGKMWIDPNNRALGVKDLPGAAKPEAPYTAQGKLKADLDAGRIDQSQFEAGMAALAPKGTKFTFDPATNQMTFTEGAGVGSPTGEPLVGDVYNPGEVQAAVGLIDQIMNTDPKVFNRITGTIAGGGGNNIDDLNAAQRFYYGDEGVATIEKLGQLGSQTWLAAREMLKGGGPITDYESRKAEAAVARLSRAKGPEELKAALQELRDAITDGEAKLRAAGRLGVASTPPATPSAGGGTRLRFDENGNQIQ